MSSFAFRPSDDGERLNAARLAAPLGEQGECLQCPVACHGVLYGLILSNLHPRSTLLVGFDVNLRVTCLQWQRGVICFSEDFLFGAWRESNSTRDSRKPI